MEVLYENLAHFTHGMTLMFFVIITILLYQKRENNTLIGLLFKVMIFFVFIHLKDIPYLINGMWLNERYTRISLSIDMWCIPVFTMFLFEVVRPGWTNIIRVVALLLPSIVLTCIVAATNSLSVFNGMLVYSNVMAGFTALWILYSTRNFNNYIKTQYSYTETLAIPWLRTLILLLFLLLVVWSVVTWADLWLGDSIYYLFSIAVFTYIYIKSIHHSVVPVPDMLNPFVDPSVDETANEKKEQEIDIRSFKIKLEQAMGQKRMYLNPELTLAEVASAIGTNRTYLSNYMNKELKTTFYDYINTYRVRDAESLLRNEKMKIEEIAYRCGFNSVSTFRRSFRKVNGITPTEFREVGQQ